MTPAAELAACKRALKQYRRAWRELALELPATDPGMVRELFRAVSRRYALPTLPPDDEHEVTDHVPD